MAKVRTADKYRAIKLRLQGKTYPFIKRQLKVSKGTLSAWLRDIKLTKSQIEKIRKNSEEKRVEAFINTFSEKRIRTFRNCLDEERKNILPITERDFFIAGLFLYLGEGAKFNWSETSISNSSPSVIKFSIFWLTKILKVKKDKIKIRLHLYSDMDIKKETKLWQKITELPKENFKNPYIKKSRFEKINYYTIGHGTCNIIVSGVDLKRKIIASIRTILEEAGTYEKDIIDNANSPRLVL